MIKKIFTKKHVFLVIEDENHNHSDAVFGKVYYFQFTSV